MRYALLLLTFMVSPAFAYTAGISANITWLQWTSTLAADSAYSPCYLTLAMSLENKRASRNFYNITVTAVDTTAKTWTGYANTTPATLQLKGNYTPCDANVSGTTAVNTIAAANTFFSMATGTDPAYAQLGAAAGMSTTTTTTSSGGLSSTDLTAMTTAISSGVNQGINGSATPSDRFKDGETLGWAMGALLVAAWGASMIRKQLR